MFQKIACFALFLFSILSFSQSTISLKGKIMRIEGVTEEQNKEQLSSLQLVNLGRTNINQVKFLSHYEFSGNQKKTQIV